MGSGTDPTLQLIVGGKQSVSADRVRLIHAR